MASSLYKILGKELISKVIISFYDKVFVDPLISHFFFSVDRARLVASQIQFTQSLLGGPATYKGLSLQKAHEGLQIRQAHLSRRQKILEETMKELGVSPELATAWLELEKRVLHLITKDKLSGQLLKGCHEG